MKRERLSGYPLWQHVLFWVLFIIYQGLSYNWENTDELFFHLQFGTATVFIPLIIITTYVNLCLLVPLFIYTRKYLAYSSSLIALVAGTGILIRYLTHALVLPWEQLYDPVRYQTEVKTFWIPVRILRLSISLLPVLAVTMCAEIVKKNWSGEQRLRESEEQRYVAEIRFLKAQINPHFFFNTLNSLYALALKRSRKLPDMLLRLSDLMHYMLYDAGVNRVLLKNEITYLENLLHLEQLRYKDRLDLSYQCSGNAEGKVVAPLLFLPLVENAIKHGLGDTGWIIINFNIDEDRLLFTIENGQPQNHHTKPGGIGLENLRKRLDMIYPEKYELTLKNNTDNFEARLLLKL